MDFPDPSQPYVQADSASVHSDFPRTSSTDLVIRSSNNVLFHLHKKNLETHTGAFPGADLPLPTASQGSEEDVTNLTESSDVLAIVFAFVYPRKQPNLKEMEFSIVIAVAEAIEKYEVFSAMGVCESRLHDFVKKQPQKILIHATKHDYLSLVDAATPYFARKPLNEIEQVLPDNLFRAWCRYRERWEHVFWIAMEHIRTNNMTASEMAQVMNWRAIPDLIRLQGELESIESRRPFKVMTTMKCMSCIEQRGQFYCDSGHYSQIESKSTGDQNVRKLAELCRAEIASIPPFTSFLR